MSKRHLVRFSRLVILLLLLAVSTADGAAASATTTTTTKTTQEQQKQPRKQQQNKEEKNDKPNIVIILIDDMGFNDVSFHGSNQILTPNIDALAYNGIILNRHYVPNLCTPSRATLLTGKYPIHTGTHHFVILNDEPWGLPLGERLMPELFRDAGYATNLVGKWHLGFWRKELTPTMRGFDHHYGYLSGYIDYYDHTLHMLDKNYSAGLDFRRDLQPWPEANGTYATELFTQQAERIIREHDARRPLFLLMSHLAVHTGNEDDPMQAPPEEVEKFMHIADPKRRIYAGMVSSLDRSVGRTVRALAQKGILNNTIVLLYSDNGAPTVGVHSNGGSNFPFRGQKESPWEGALRSAGAIWSPLLKRRRYVSNQVVHAIDWLPTLASAAGVRLPERLQLDGVDVWDALSHGREPQPRRLLHVMDDVFGYSAFLRGDLKYVNGTTFDGLYDGWLSAAPPPDQEDPRAAFYVQEVLSSEVHRLLGALDAGPALGVAQVEAQRQEATHRCPPDDRDPADPLFRCEPLVAACVFDLARDPCERFNLARLHPLQVALLRQEVEQFRPGVRPSARVPHPDPQCDPALHGGTWQWWDGAGGGRAASSGWTPSPHLLELLFLAVVCTWRGSATVF